MHDTIDLGGAPANEPCAQLGVTPDFERFNRLEVKAYAVAMQARFGPPSEGASYVVVSNVHDFGTYYTLGLRIASAASKSQEVRDYIEAAEAGLGSWTQAGMAPPVQYDGASVALGPRRDLDAVIRGALSTTRPDGQGRFPIPDFAVLHGNLARAFPQHAAAFRQPEPEGTHS